MGFSNHGVCNDAADVGAEEERVEGVMLSPDTRCCRVRWAMYGTIKPRRVGPEKEQKNGQCKLKRRIQIVRLQGNSGREGPECGA